MKGILLAGGAGTRLDPLTRVTNKHLLPVYDEPMIFKSIKTLKESGIADIQMVIGGNGVGDIVKICGSGASWDVNLSYVHQDKPTGIADALRLTSGFADSESVVVLLADNVFEDSFEREVAQFGKSPDICHLFIKKVSSPERFGVVEFDEKGQVTSIEEKPDKPKSSYAVTGLYFYPSDVYEVIEWVEKEIGYSARGELEISDANQYYVSQGRARVAKVKGFWSDAGTFPSLYHASSFVAKNS